MCLFALPGCPSRPDQIVARWDGQPSTPIIPARPCVCLLDLEDPERESAVQLCGCWVAIGRRQRSESENRQPLLASAVGHIISTMTLKSAAFFALIGMVLLTVLLALAFIRDVSAILTGAIAAVTVLASLIHLLASLSVTVFFYVFYKAQS
jgi:hypothetical protein